MEVIFIFLSRRRFCLFICILFFLAGCTLYGQSPATPIPQFQGERQVENNAGQIKLIWQIADSLLAADLHYFELQQSREASFADNRVLYKGSDLASFISGLPDGDYYFRVRTLTESTPGQWSDTLHLKVNHQSLELAFTLFGLGAVVFISTVILILYGNKKTKEEADA